MYVCSLLSSGDPLRFLCKYSTQLTYALVRAVAVNVVRWADTLVASVSVVAYTALKIAAVTVAFVSTFINVCIYHDNRKTVKQISALHTCIQIISISMCKELKFNNGIVYSKPTHQL
jgi:hypothetical protein